jgi:WD40 repeat protein
MANTAGTAEPGLENAPHLVLEAGGHLAIIRELLFTADGRDLISVSDDKTIRVWTVSPDGRRAALARTIRGQIDEGRAGLLAAAALSPRDAAGRQQWLAVGGFLAGPLDDRYAVRLHDYASGEVIALLHGHRDIVLALAFSPNGRWLASASKDYTIRLWDLASLQGKYLTRMPLELTGHTDHIYDLAWSATGDRLASAAFDRTVGLWNTSQLTQSQATLIARLRGHDSQVRTVAFHPDSTVLLSAGWDQTLRQWRASDGKDLKVFARADHKVSALAFSPDGRLLLAGNDAPPKPDRLTLYSYPSGKVQHIFTGHHNSVFATAFHPTGQWVASGGGDQKEILLWQVPTGDILSRLEGKGQTVEAVGFSADGRYLSWGQTWRYKSVNDRGPLEHRFDLTQLTRLPGGLPSGAAVQARERVQQLALTTESGGPYGYEYRLHISRGSTRLGTVERGEANGSWHRAYTFTPNGQYVLSGGLHGVLELYSLDGQVRARLVGHAGEIKAVAVSADGRWAVSGSVDQTLKLWPLADIPASGSTEIVPTLTLFPAADGEWVAWRPEGFFAASTHGAALIGYSINQGLDKLARYVSVDQLYERFYRPDLIHAKLHGDPQRLWQQDGALTNVEIILAEALPPYVAFTTPSSDVTVTRRDIALQVKLTDHGGGIGKVLWKVDGVTTAVEPSADRNATRGTPADKASPGGNVVTLTRQITLVPGKNTVEVIAYDRRNELSSPPAVRIVTLMPESAPSPDTVGPVASLPTPTAPTPPAAAPVTPPAPPPQATPPAPPAQAVAPPTPPPREVVPPAPPAKEAAPPAPPPREIAPPQTVQQAMPVSPTLHLLVMAVNRYRDRALWLNYAVPDAQALVAALRRAAAPLFSDPIITMLLDEQVTLHSLEVAFTQATARIKPQDVFVLYIAGHGVTRDGRYYFLPQDFRYNGDASVQQGTINQDHLQHWLARVPARKSLVLIDTCESGSMTHSFSQSLVSLRGMVEKTAVDKLTRATGRATIVAATDTQPALEGYQGHGVFTYVLLQALQRADTSHGNRDGITGIFELAAYVDDQVPAITQQAFKFEQFPQVHMVGSDFPIGTVTPYGSSGR